MLVKYVSKVCSRPQMTVVRPLRNDLSFQRVTCFSRGNFSNSRDFPEPLIEDKYFSLTRSVSPSESRAKCCFECALTLSLFAREKNWVLIDLAAPFRGTIASDTFCFVLWGFTRDLWANSEYSSDSSNVSQETGVVNKPGINLTIWYETFSCCFRCLVQELRLSKEVKQYRRAWPSNAMEIQYFGKAIFLEIQMTI